ncbi:unnamed protein product [Phytophthora fragariaefolia]|uniref:Unnamed protein product n=1 Tax=Phytophthora fragariaefolia TaxID=1490495 RepID=A0A9W7D1P6_9STRA|nr:unnamed protein product [Phytophthora fragariaefolia]
MEALAVRGILQEILPRNPTNLELGIDSQAAYVMATNPTHRRRTRHIELRWHYVREQVEKGAIKLHKVKGEENPTDPFTKALEKKHLKRLLQDIGVGTAIYVEEQSSRRACWKAQPRPGKWEKAEELREQVFG